MNKKAFLLTDSLITISILIAMSTLILSLFSIINNQDLVYKNYIEKTNDELENIYSLNDICEVCMIDE